MNISTLKLKWIYLPLGLVLAATGISLAAGQHTSKPDITISQGTGTDAGAAINTEDPKVTINGQTVEGEGQFQVGNATVNVTGNSTTVNGGGSTTTFTNSQGGVDVHVESNSSSGFSSHTVTTGGGTFTFTNNNSGISVFQSGEGNISASN